MGLFGGSKSKSGAAQGSAATQTQLGDPQAVNLSAGDDIKNANVNITTGDFGAIQAALSFADRDNERGYKLLEKQINASGGASRRIVNVGVGSARQILNAGAGSARDILNASGGAGRQILNAGAGSARDILDFADRARDDVFELSRDGLDFARDALAYSADQGDLVADTVGGLAESFQSFVNKENNPGERVNLFLIVAVFAGAVVFMGRK